MPAELLAPPGPTPSCRLDFLTCSFKLHTLDHVEELLNLVWQIGYHVLPNGELRGPLPCRLFKETWKHDSGVYAEVSPPNSGARNEGMGTLAIPGSVFAALDVVERSELYREIRSKEGFYRCTRVDTQLTVLDPPVTIYGFVDEYLAGNLWPKGYSTARPWIERDALGRYKAPPTLYFGASSSPTIARIYDHGEKWEWDQPSMRFEIQQRKRNADDTFRSLIQTTTAEDVASPLLLEAEANLCKAVLREKLDLRDTTGIDREALGGNWLRSTQPVGWYRELVDAPGAPVERRTRPVPTLNRSMRACSDQYGGKRGAYALQTMAVEGCTLKQVGEALCMRDIGMMNEQHRALAKQGLTAKEAARVDRLYAKLQPEGARMAEFAWVDD